MTNIELTLEFVKLLNETLTQLNNTKNGDETSFNTLKKKISEIQNLLKNSDKMIQQLMKRINEIDISKDDIIYVYKNNVISHVLSTSLMMETYANFPDVKYNCCHNLKFVPFKNLSYSISYIDSEYKFLNLIKKHSTVLVDVYDHNYRVYRNVVCFIILVDTAGRIYIIDALKLRKCIYESKFFMCGIKKIFYTRRSFYKVKRDYKNIGCFVIMEDSLFKNYNYDDSESHEEYETLESFKNIKFSRNISFSNITVNEVFVDWRLRPLDNYLRLLLLFNIKKMCKVYQKIYKDLINITDRIKRIKLLEVKGLTDEVSLRNNIKEMEDYEAMNNINYALKVNDLSPLEFTFEEQDFFNKFLNKNSKNKCFKALKYDFSVPNNTIINCYKNQILFEENDSYFVENDNDILYLDRDSSEYFSVVNSFLKIKYGLNEDPYLFKLLSARENIAKANNESIYYIMTDDQLINIYHGRPSSYEDFYFINKLTSSFVKRSIRDFLLKSEENKVNLCFKMTEEKSLLKTKKSKTKSLKIEFEKTSNKKNNFKVKLDNKKKSKKTKHKIIEKENKIKKGKK